MSNDWTCFGIVLVSGSLTYTGGFMRERLRFLFLGFALGIALGLLVAWEPGCLLAVLIVAGLCGGAGYFDRERSEQVLG